MQAVVEAVGQRALLLISHQPLGLRHFDQILLLEQGTVVESGDWQSLMSQQSRLKSLLGNQLHLRHLK